jgi:hypothetical protein
MEGVSVFKYSDTAMKAMTERRGGGQTRGSVRRQDGGRLALGRHSPIEPKNRDLPRALKHYFP